MTIHDEHLRVLKTNSELRADLKASNSAWQSAAELVDKQREQIKVLREALQSIKDNGGPTMENGWPGRVCSDVAESALKATE